MDSGNEKNWLRHVSSAAHKFIRLCLLSAVDIEFSFRYIFVSSLEPKSWKLGSCSLKNSCCRRSWRRWRQRMPPLRTPNKRTACKQIYLFPFSFQSLFSFPHLKRYLYRIPVSYLIVCLTLFSTFFFWLTVMYNWYWFQPCVLSSMPQQDTTEGQGVQGEGGNFISLWEIKTG